MRRSWPFRLLAAFMACWLALSIAEPGVLHACPTHDLVVGSAPSGAGPMHGGHAGHSGHDAAQMDAAMSQGAGHLHQQHQQHQGAQHCCCLGTCAASGSVALGASSVVLAELSTSATRDAGLPAHDYRPVERAHRLPFANGPPAI